MGHEHLSDQKNKGPQPSESCGNQATIKACDLDDKQRDINHVNSYSTANLGIASNSTFASFTAPQPQTFVSS